MQGISGQRAVVDGRDAWLVEGTLAFDNLERTVALTTNGGRAFVISATGFDAVSPSGTATARRRALLDFLERFEFRGPPLFISAALGFEAPQLVEAPPVVTSAAGSRERAGVVVFAGATAERRSAWTWVRVTARRDRRSI